MESIEYGTERIDFTIERTDRKTLGIEVHPDRSVRIISPLDALLKDVHAKVEKRASWIIKQQRYFEQFLPRTPKREYLAGETHYYLGRRYVLRIEKGDQQSIKLKGGILLAQYTHERSSKSIKNLLTQWYFEHAQRKFAELFQSVLMKFQNYNIGTPDFEIRRMKNRWGSCTPKGKIILNPELIKVPSKCIEYVIIHELCHLVHRNHDKVFYQLQDELFPENAKWKERLEKTLT